MACDISREYAEVGKPVWKEAGVDHKIDLRIGEATKTLRKLFSYCNVMVTYCKNCKKCKI